jgi:cytochrome b6-f complex iron-sulfur subunit
MATMMNRREFLFLAAAVIAGCSSPPPGTVSGGPRTRFINAGPASDYTAEGLYPRFRISGFFIVRRRNQLFAISSICTHRRCRLNAEPDRSFSCPCHGSTFDPKGHLTKGPAKRDLPVLATFINESGELIVKLPSS